MRLRTIVPAGLLIVAGFSTDPRLASALTPAVLGAPSTSSLVNLLEVPLLKSLWNEALPQADSTGLYVFQKDGQPLFYVKQGSLGYVAAVPVSGAALSKLDPLKSLTVSRGFFFIGSSKDVLDLFGSSVLGTGAIAVSVGDASGATADASFVAFGTPREGGPLGPLLKAKLLSESPVALRGTLSGDLQGLLAGTETPELKLSIVTTEEAVFHAPAAETPKLTLGDITYSFALKGGEVTLSAQANRVFFNSLDLGVVELAFKNPQSPAVEVTLSSQSKKSLPALGKAPLTFQIQDLGITGTLSQSDSSFALESTATFLGASLGASLNAGQGSLDAEFRLAKAPPIQLPNGAGRFTLEHLTAAIAPSDASIDLLGKLELDVQGKMLAFQGHVTASRAGIALSGTSLNDFTSPKGAFGLSTTTLYGSVAPDGVSVGLSGRGTFGSTHVSPAAFCIAGVPGALKQAGMRFTADSLSAGSLFAMTNEVLGAAQLDPVKVPDVSLPTLSNVDIYYLTPLPTAGVNCKVSALGLSEEKVVAGAKVALMGLGSFDFKLQASPAKKSAVFDATLEGNSKELEATLRKALPLLAAKENAAVRGAKRAVLNAVVSEAAKAEGKIADGLRDVLGKASASVSELQKLCNDVSTLVREAKPLCTELGKAADALDNAEDALATFDQTFDDSLSRSRSALAVLSSELTVRRVKVSADLGSSGGKTGLELVLGLGTFELSTKVALGGKLPANADALTGLVKGEIAFSFDQAAAVQSSPAAKAKASAAIRQLDHVDAAVEWSGDKSYFFDGGKYQRIGTPGDSTAFIPDMPHLRDGPVRGADAWKDCTFCYGIEAAFRKGNYAYFFKGDEYVRWNLERDVQDQGPLKIASLWPALPAQFRADLDAAVVWGGDYQFVLLFKGNQVIRIRLENKAVDAPTTIAQFFDINANFDAGIDAAVNFYNGKIYLFKGDKYIRLSGSEQDSGYPKAIRGNWP